MPDVSNPAPLTLPPRRDAYTPTEVAGRLGMHYRRVLRLIHAGDLRAVRVSARCFVIPRDALAEYLAARG